jgi:hypothetical protein
LLSETAARCGGPTGRSVAHAPQLLLHPDRQQGDEDEDGDERADNLVDQALPPD